MLSSRPFPETRPSLLCSLRDGQPQPSAWREFFERYAPAVFRVARRQGLDTHEADDIVQETMLAVAKHIAAFDYRRDRGKFRQWVTTIAANKGRDLLRRQSAACERLGVPQAQDPADGRPTLGELWEQEWQAQDMLWCLDRVGEEIAPQRMAAFELYVLQGVSAEETGKRLGMTRAHVYVTRSQVVRRIRTLMEELDSE